MGYTTEGVRDYAMSGWHTIPALFQNKRMHVGDYMFTERDTVPEEQDDYLTSLFKQSSFKCNAPIKQSVTLGGWGKKWNDQALIYDTEINVNGRFYKYVGDFTSTTEVPRTICCYTIGDEFHTRNIIPNLNVPAPKIARRSRPDDTELIKTDIKDTDNSLMVMMKTALAHKKVTKGIFKAAYDNDSDMHNALFCIEKGDNLSWARFTDMCRRFGLYYSLCVYDDDTASIEEIDTGKQ